MLVGEKYYDLGDNLQGDAKEMEIKFLTVCDADRSAFPDCKRLSRLTSDTNR